MEIVGSQKEFAEATQVANWTGLTTLFRDTLIYEGLTFGTRGCRFESCRACSRKPRKTTGFVGVFSFSDAVCIVGTATDSIATRVFTDRIDLPPDYQPETT
jgi:hypothetical protein